MKTSFVLSRAWPLLVASLLPLAASSVRAAEDVVVRRFDDISELAGWRFDYGGTTNLIEFDATQDASNNVASGSLKITLGFDAVALAGNNKGAVTVDLPAPLDGSTYLTMEMDVKIAPGSATDTSSNSGFFQMVIRNGANYSFNTQFGATVSTNDGWRHISVPPSGTHDDIHAITLELSGGGGGAGSVTGPVTFYVDNVKFTKPSSLFEVVVDQFNDLTGLAGWRFDYGGATNLLEFDATQDGLSNPASGSLKVTLGFDAANLNPAGNNKGAVTHDLPAPLDGTAYLSMEMDVKVAPGSVTDSSGNSGFFQMVIRDGPFYDFNSQFGGNLNTNDGWRHIVVAPPMGGFTDIRAVTLELSGGGDLTGTVVLSIDNIKFTTSNTPPPEVAMTIETPAHGLNLISTSGQYQRQSIGTVANTSYSWVGSADPVTYSVTIGAYPDASHSGYQTHIFLVPGAPTSTVPDYSEPNLVFLDIQNQADGSARAYFRYKTNEANGNSFLYSSGSLGNVAGASPLGTWSIAFVQDTNVTVKAPDGTIGQFVLPSAAAALFQNPLTVYVGDQPNAGGNVGQSAILNRFQITSGPNILLDDNFLADVDLDVATWRLAADDANGIKVIGADAAFWLSWSTPSTGFGLQSNSDLAPGSSWTDLGWTVPLLGTRRKILVYTFSTTPDPAKTYAPTPDHAYFRLIKP